jgi:hypothetical protein
MTERRQRRSSDPLIALHYQLSYARHDGGLEAIVVADPSGVMVAGSGSWALCEELAAYAPLLARGPDGWGEGSRVSELGADVDVHTLVLDGQEVLLCARGPKDGGAVERAARGVARILRA